MIDLLIKENLLMTDPPLRENLLTTDPLKRENLLMRDPLLKENLPMIDLLKQKRRLPTNNFLMNQGQESTHRLSGKYYYPILN